ncbi:CHRD domain-containing protein [Steroidobacter sp.]|uniref:CHRD domain-containing protein n=1 Tax=Steroidobacter sp. TaxID=1978227 RepID=UPI001A4A00CE|nr:CHRD domain-containing protein [Steroidobacter sp.]MBL8266116.1 CHRD domain-containing protein [Steroidobacter sp.]
MSVTNRNSMRIAGMLALLSFAAGNALAGDIKVTLTGEYEVPAVTTKATGSGTITIKDDKTVTGSVTTKELVGVAAHIHVAPVGKNGPPAITMTKTADNVWSVPEGSKLSDEQYAAFKAGDLYVNVHSAANKGGEIRGQLKP